jgi:hypothetical protein
MALRIGTGQVDIPAIGLRAPFAFSRGAGAGPGHTALRLDHVARQVAEHSAAFARVQVVAVDGDGLAGLSRAAIASLSQRLVG